MIVDALHGLARQADDALDERHVGLRGRALLGHFADARRMEDEHVTALGIGEPADEARRQHAVALVDRRPHRSRRDAVRACDVLLHEPRESQRDRDDDDELGDCGPRRLLARGDREAQLDPLSDPLALGRSGHGLG